MIESPSLVGESPAFSALVQRLDRVAAAGKTTLVTGPTGSGKEVVAHELHRRSCRSRGPFVPVHCGALADSVIEAELFGHAKGAFTGAEDARQGLIGAAAGGTLFLDEINSLSLHAQARLLRFLESGEFRRVGSDRPLRSDAWVVAATNEDLCESCGDGRFREDLRYRLEVVRLDVPPLRARGEDILLLANHFLSMAGGEELTFDVSARRALFFHDWPGNVRELRNRIEGAVVLGGCDGTITADALGLSEVAGEAATVGGAPAGPLSQQLWSLVEDNGMSLGEAVSLCERILVGEALKSQQGNRTRAARTLGIHVRTLFKKLSQADCVESDDDDSDPPPHTHTRH